MDATLPQDFHRAPDVEVCQVLGCPVGSRMATEIAQLRAALAYAEAQHAHKHAQMEAARLELMETEQRLVRLEMRHGVMAEHMALIVRAIDANHFGTAFALAVESLKEDANVG